MIVNFDFFSYYDLIVMLSGTVIGFAAGLIPGIGLLVTMLLAYPFLLDFSIFQLLLFYAAAGSASQFSGSIVATVLGIPGEASSLPAVREGPGLMQQGKANFAISNAAMGSVLGAFITMLGVIIIMPIVLSLLTKYYNNSVQMVILCLSAFSIILLHGKNKILNAFLFMFGIFLGQIGMNPYDRSFGFDWIIPYAILPDLRSGLPFFPLVIALFVIPVFFKNYQNSAIHANKKYEDNNSVKEHLSVFVKNLPSALRGTGIGTFAGLIPHIGTVLASNVSYAMEKHIGIKRKTYNEKGDIKCLVSAETANNSGFFMQLMPLVLLGIPITTSEAIILSLIERNTATFTFVQTFSDGLFGALILWFIAANILAFTFSWPIIKYVNYLHKIPLKAIFITTLVSLVFLIYIIGAREWSEMYYIMTFLILAPIGYLLRRTETIIVIVGFILENKIYASLTIFWTVFTAP